MEDGRLRQRGAIAQPAAACRSSLRNDLLPDNVASSALLLRSGSELIGSVQ